MIYMGTRDAIETPSAALEALPEPYNFASQIMLQVKPLSKIRYLVQKISHLNEEHLVRFADTRAPATY